MSLWLIRAGESGEYEDKFLDENRIYLTWQNLDPDLSKVSSWEELKESFADIYSVSNSYKIGNASGQIWTFAKRLEPGDWFVLPSKRSASIHVGRITSDYKFDQDGESPYMHYRTVEWIETDVPRTNFDQDLLNSFGAHLTICQIRRHDAESRVKDMANSGWKSSPPQVNLEEDLSDDVSERSESYDIERLAKDQLTRFLIQKFQGHDLARIIDAILQAKGYATFRSPPGPDKGVDILAAPGSLGFGSPRICVQVKSGDMPVDRPTLDQLLGTMQNFRAEHGLLVSWGGFKSSVLKEQANQFFKVRFWDSDLIIEELLNSYEKLDDDKKAEIPLKRVWSLSLSDD